MGVLPVEEMGDVVEMNDLPNIFVQWKGTELCADLRCVCGHNGHYDDDFFYNWECVKCQRRYKLPHHIVPKEMTKKEIDSVLSRAGNDALAIVLAFKIA